MKFSYYSRYPKNGKTHIYISVYQHSDTRVRLPIGIEIENKYWDSRTKTIKKSIPNYFDYKKNFDRIENEINELSLRCKAANNILSTNQLKQEIKKVLNPNLTKKLNFVEKLREFIEGRYASDFYRKGTAKNYVPLLNLIVKFQKDKRKQITFRSIDRGFMNEFHEYMINQDDIYNSYAKKQLSNLKTFLNQCYTEGLIDDISFRDFSPKNSKQSTRTDLRLNSNELKTIENYNPKTDSIRKAKDLFLIQCYTGLRVSDLMKLSFENFDMIKKEIRLVTTKTSNAARIPISSSLNDILKKYNYLELPKLSDQYYNRKIKQLCKEAEINTKIPVEKYSGSKVDTKTYEKWELMSSNIARKTFITRLLELGLKDFEIMKITGHRKRETISKYISITDDEAVDKARILLN